MKKIAFGFFGSVIVLGAVLQVALGGRKVVQVSSNKREVGGLTVSIFGNDQNGEFEVSQTDQNGIAEFGAGFWSWPWRDDKLILAVQSGDKMELEGLVVPSTSRVIEIPIDEDDQGGGP